MSFPTISGSGPNGAIIHYKATIESNRKLSDDRLRSEIYDMCYDKLFELVKGRDNLYDLKIKFEELI